MGKLHSNKHNTRWKNLWRKEHCSKLGHWDSSMEVFAEEELSGQITLWKAFMEAFVLKGQKKAETHSMPWMHLFSNAYSLGFSADAAKWSSDDFIEIFVEYFEIWNKFVWSLCRSAEELILLESKFAASLTGDIGPDRDRAKTHEANPNFGNF